MLYKKWLKEWLEVYVKPTSKQKTYNRYSEIVSQHIVKALGDYEMKELTPLVLQRFITELLKCGNLKTGKGLSSNSVNGVITIVQSSLKIAFGIGLLDVYNADKVKRPKITEKQVTCFTQTEQKQIEYAILNDKNSKLFGVVFCLYTGLRIGELLALTWNDIDFDRELVLISKTCYDGVDENGKFTRLIDTPKTETSVRVVPFPKQFIPYLRKKQKIDGYSGYVFGRRGSKVVSVRTYQRRFAELLKKLEIQHKGFHSLRHTFATRALECGMDVRTLSEILGHKNATVTLNRYAHSLMEHKKNMINRLWKQCTLSSNK